MRLTLLPLLLALSACTQSAADEPRDAYRDANLCEQVSSGPVPVLLATGDEMFNAGDLALRDNRLYFRINSRDGWLGGVALIDLATGEAHRWVDGDIDHLTIGRSSLFYYEHARELFRHRLTGGTTSWDLRLQWVGELAGDPTSDAVWLVKSSGVSNENGALYRMGGGALQTIATGGFDDTLAVSKAGVWAITRFGSGKNAQGSVVFLPHGGGEFRSLVDYSADDPLDLRADDAAAVYMFEHSIGTVTADGGPRELHFSRGKLGQLAIDSSYAYFVEKTSYGSAIRRAPRDGSAGAETLTETRCAPQSLVVGPGRVFFTTYAWGNDRPSPGAVWSLALP